MSDTDIAQELAEDIEYPAFHPSVIPVQVNKDTFHVRGGPWKGPIFTIHDVEGEGVISDLSGLVDGQTHVSEILDAFDTEEQREEVARALQRLDRSGVVYDLNKQQDPMYPHMAVRSRFRTQDRKRLDDRSVLVVNAGRMGTQIAADLFEMGVTDVGMVQPIAGAAGDTSELEQWSSFELFADDELEDAIRASEFVVYTSTQAYPELEERINRTAYESRTPWVPAQVQGFDGIVGPAIYPGETACYRCFRERTLASVTGPEGLAGYYDTLAEDDSLAARSIPAFERAVAGYLSLDLLNLLAFDMGYTVGTVVLINSIDMGVEADRVLKLPRCEVCGEATSTDVGRFVTIEDLVEAGERNRHIGGE
jgi:bacteriocin biosynthesis cyclodehydratase domain-containing protein